MTTDLALDLYQDSHNKDKIHLVLVKRFWTKDIRIKKQEPTYLGILSLKSLVRAGFELTYDDMIDTTTLSL